MALVECPYCKAKISDSAPVCLHCGQAAHYTPREQPRLIAKMLWLLVALAAVGVSSVFARWKYQEHLANTSSGFVLAVPARNGTDTAMLGSTSAGTTTYALPIYNTDGYCRGIALSTPGNNSDIEQSCHHHEDAARDWLLSHPTSSRVLNTCAGIGNTAGGSYSLIKACINREEASSGNE